MSKSTTANNAPPLEREQSPSSIRILPEEVISKISAGEVVERPSSVIKELIENSLDATARKIVIEIEGAGKKLIRVTDDGEGIPRNEITLALQRHATSKINSYDDLFKLQSMGFRGEALAAIGAVAEVKIESNRRGNGGSAGIGAGAKISFGKITGPFPSAIREGTSVEVTRLFFNTPARMKFLKSDATEKNSALQVIQSLAIANPETAFEVFYDKKNILRLNAVSSLEDRIFAVLKEDIFLKTLPFSFTTEKGEISIAGRISSLDSFVPSKNIQYLFVNKRYVYSRTAYKAIYNALKGILPSGKHPIFIIYLTISPDKVDVNVSPTKKDVKFSDEDAVYSAIFLSIKKLFDSHPPVDYGIRKGEYKPSHLKDTTPTFTSYGNQPNPVGGNFQSVKWLNEQIANLKTGASQCADLISADDLRESKVKFIGEIFGYCLLASDEENLYMIDSHAASERILYENYKNAKNKSSSQMLLSPIVINLPLPEFERAKSNLHQLQELGWRLETFGQNSLRCEGTPAALGEVNPSEILNAIFGNTDQSDEDYSLKEKSGALKNVFTDEYIIRKSCHAAIRGRDKLSFVEAQKLINELFASPSYQTCPHGRPTVIRLGRDELLKKFRKK